MTHHNLANNILKEESRPEVMSNTLAATCVTSHKAYFWRVRFALTFLFLFSARCAWNHWNWMISISTRVNADTR